MVLFHFFLRAIAWGAIEPGCGRSGAGLDTLCKRQAKLLDLTEARPRLTEGYLTAK